MAKNKLAKFAENNAFEHVFQPPYSEVLYDDFKLKGKWQTHFFKNNNPIIIEIGCGKGEYTVGLARRFPDHNFIGIDIKGARMWRGARQVKEEGLLNVAFIRTRVEFITSFFEHDEVAQIWITFPDPQLKNKRRKKRLTSPRFLSAYQELLKNNGLIHLKTDNEVLYQYTLDLARYNHLEIKVANKDIYKPGMTDDVLSIQTFYESQFLEKGVTIKYLQFILSKEKTIEELPEKS